MGVIRPALFLALALLASACAITQRPPLSKGAAYAAMGSSFAAGPGITTPADTPPTRCGRSQDNYPHQLARALNLSLTDVTCSGATTAHLLGPWRELPAQLDALTPETALVTITIGGNDIGYIASLFAASCAAQPKAAICARITAPPPVTTAQWQSLAQNFAAIAAEVRRRAPRARLVFVDYLTVLPPTALCPETPMSPAQAAQGRALARKLARLTARAARKAGATLIPASTASASHHACAKTPWMTGFTPPPGAQGFVPYHPNQPGMTAVAKALEAALSPRAAPSAAR